MPSKIFPEPETKTTHMHLPQAQRQPQNEYCRSEHVLFLSRGLWGEES